MSNINITSFYSKGYENVNLEVKGTQEFLGKEIPVIYGGFGSNQKVVLAKTIAEIHGMPVSEINRNINNNIKRFKDGVDIVDLKQMGDAHTFSSLGFTKAQWGNANNIYLLSERGYAKLIKIMDSDLAWDIHDQLMDEYFSMREEKSKPVSQLDAIIAGLQATKELQEKMVVVEQVQVQQQQAIQNIRNVVAINTTDWRKDTTNIINRIAMSRDGGAENIHIIRKESYDLLEKRANCKLSVRRKNLQRVMLENGVSKSKVDKITYLDVIERDNRLKEIYIAIVKEMAIKYNVA
ncbi:ORF6N domain-containing protein [Turicibacter sanguinis]|uniref:ORF6N domain-containing protein n=1 Tax=Turicibacter sanguinis TaxID=154288 RepID=UPI0018A9D52F|nr:ORF6N domain-containing protein [Turicibacter sanguinis]MDB8552615.1 ORF6N domain-containing protein [Turicibacter sanguinis]